MAVTFQKNPDGIIAVYCSTTYKDETDGKMKPKKIYLGTMKDGVFLPTNHKRGRSHKSISEPVEIDKDMEMEIKLLYLEAENRRLNKLIEEIGSLIQPTLEKAGREKKADGAKRTAQKTSKKNPEPSKS